MSIEKNITRIADALERIATALESNRNAAPAAVAQIPTAPTAAPAPAAAAPAAAAPAAVPAPAPAAAAPAMTLEQLNAALGQHFVRLGNNREPIDRVMREQFGIQSIRDLPVEKYQTLVDAVAAIPAPVAA